VRAKLPDDRFARAFWGMIAGTFILTAIFAWQAVESQEVKGSLKGGFAQPVTFESGPGDVTGVATHYVNTGDQTVELESVGLVEPVGVELVGVGLGNPAATPLLAEVDGYAVAPGEAVDLWVEVETTGSGTVGFEGLRVHYRAGGRAGQTVG
jgi:hypothetical protein